VVGVRLRHISSGLAVTVLILFALLRWADATFADASADSTFESYSQLPPELGDGTIRWKDRVVIAVSVLPIEQADFDHPEQLSRSAQLQFAALSSTIYAKTLADASGLRYSAAVGTTISVNVVGQILPVERPSSSATTRTLGIVRNDGAGQAICSLRLTWAGGFIQFAWIEIKSSASKIDGERCLSELIWRSFGFPGKSKASDLWVDQTLSESEKVNLIKRLYGREP
jgi:hypothetical protein